MKQYVWCEDRGSGYEFWTKIFRVINPEITVQTKENNTGLRKAATKITEDGNKYYILIDNAIDNPDVLREIKKLNVSIQGKSNVSVIKIHSFELTLLSFGKLEDWVFAEVDDLKEKRRYLLDAGKSLVNILLNGGDAGMLADLREGLKYPRQMNTEQISARLLFEITRNTGFETGKGHLGECFINSCCEWEERQPDDICGLDEERLSSNEKVKQIVEKSVLKDVLDAEGL